MRKRTILSIFVVIMLISISGSQAMIDLTGTQQGSGSSSFSGRYTDLDFSGTTGLSDGVDNDSGGGGVAYDQDLNTTDSPTFDGETLTGDLDMSTNDINNVNNINVDNDIILNDRLEHTGDGDTYMDFNNNEILWYAGGTLLLTLQQSGLTINDNVTISENITGNGSGLTIDWNNLFNVPTGFADGVDNTGGSGYNQSLNTTDDVTFNSVNASDWSDVSITESQITDLDHYTDSDIDGSESAFDNWDKNATDDMNSTGSPSNGQVAVFVDENTIEGDGSFTWDSGSSILTISELTGGTAQIILDVSAVDDGGEGYLSFRDGGDIVGVNRIGTTELEISAYSNHNRDLVLSTGNHNANTNDVIIKTGYTTGGNSGNITLTPGTATGTRGDIRLGTLTTNGFVTTNNGDGTLGVNTTISWDELSDIPGGFDDDTDDVGVYYADNATLNLTGYVFSINTSIFGENLTWDGNYLNATNTGYTNESEISLNYLMYADTENKFDNDDLNSVIYNLSLSQDDLWSPGWISGGTITNNYDGTVDILGGTGYAIQDGHIRKINWTTVTSFGGFTNQSVNYIYVNADETVYKTFNPGNSSDVFLGAVYNMSGNCYVWNLPVRGTEVDYWQSAYSSRAIGALVQDGCGISVNGTLMPTIESGVVFTVTDRFSISEHTQFYRYYTTDNNVSWTMESYNNSVDVNRWDSPTGLASLGDDWKKDLMCIDYSNDVCYYIYGQKTYENESDARDGVIPTIPAILDSVSVYTCTFVVNSSVTSINDYAVDVRPYFARLFGVAPPAVSEATTSVNWADILNRPSGLDDGDDVLSEAEVDSYADDNNYFDKDTDNIENAGNGTWGFIFTSSNRSILETVFGWGNHALANYLDLDTYPNADTDSTDDFSGSWNDLTDVPADFSDDTDNVDTNWNNLTNVPSGFSDDVDNDTVDTNWNNLTNVPSGFADGVDNISGNIFNQSLNTTDNVLFNNVSINNSIILRDTEYIAPSYYANFDGDGDYITIADESDFDILTDVTYSAWVKWNVTPGSVDSWATILDKSASTWNADVRIQHSTNNDYFEWSVSGDWVFSSTSPNKDIWYHVVGTYDGSYMTIYVNGVNETSDVKTGNINQNNEPVTIGATSVDQFREFSGSIDDIRIYDRALSDTEVNTLYNNGRDSTTESLDSDGNLISNWNFESNDYTDRITDNDGTANGDTNIGVDASGSDLKELTVSFNADNNIVNFGEFFNSDIIYKFCSENGRGLIKSCQIQLGKQVASNQTLIRTNTPNGGSEFLYYPKLLSDGHMGHLWYHGGKNNFLGEMFQYDANHPIITKSMNNWTELTLIHENNDSFDDSTGWRLRSEGGNDGEHDLVIQNYAGVNVGGWNNEYMRMNQTTGDTAFNSNVTAESLTASENVTVGDTLSSSGGGTTWNMYVNATGVLVWEME